MFQTSGGSWTLNASTTIAADGIGTAPQPNLVLVPKYMMSRPAKPVTKTALIIAVILNDNETITYHVQLSDGRVVKLYGDQYVHNIDRMDPTQPPGLSLVTSPTMHHLKRDVLDRYEEADSQIQASSAQLTKRGVEDVSAYSATVSAETCASITCLNNGGKPAQYNPFLNSCYCQTLVPLELSPIAKVKRSAPEADEDALRRDMHDSSKIPPFWGNRPSARTCRYMLSCPGESTPYFDEATSQCLCVVYRKGFEEPVIASDTKMLPRAAAEETTEGEEDVERKQIPYDPGFNPAGSPFQFCTEDRVWYCNREHGSYAAWDPRIQAWCWCYQKPLWPADKELPPLAE